VGAAIACVLVGTALGASRPNDDDRLLAFSSDRNGGEDDDYSPSWSPDGKWIAFARDVGDVADVWIVSADGTKERRVTRNSHDDLSPTWSADNRHLLFESDRAGDYNVYETNLSGTKVERLTSSDSDDRYPSWQPG